jgi:hypothetical protein
MATSSSHPPRSGYRLDGAPPRASSELLDALRRATTVEEANGRAALDPAAVAKPGSAERHSKGGIEGLIGRRVAAATEHALEGPNQTLMRLSSPCGMSCASTTSGSSYPVGSDCPRSPRS